MRPDKQNSLFKLDISRYVNENKKKLSLMIVIRILDTHTITDCVRDVGRAARMTGSGLGKNENEENLYVCQ